MLRASFCNIVNSMPANYFKNHKNAVKEIGASVSSGLDKETELFSVYNAKKEILYSSGQLSPDSSLLDKVDKKHSAYKICKIKGNYYLRTISYMILSADLNSYYIETITDINAIYLQRQEMTRMYHYIIFHIDRLSDRIPDPVVFSDISRPCIIYVNTRFCKWGSKQPCSRSRAG